MTSTTNNQQKTPRGRVSFSDVEIREFELTFLSRGQHSRQKGPALSLDWQFTECPAESVVDYEQRRPERRSASDLFMDHKERRRQLIEDFGFTDAQLDRANNAFLVGRSPTMVILRIAIQICSAIRSSSWCRQTASSHLFTVKTLCYSYSWPVSCGRRDAS